MEMRLITSPVTLFICLYVFDDYYEGAGTYVLLYLPNFCATFHYCRSTDMQVSGVLDLLTYKVAEFKECLLILKEKLKCHQVSLKTTHCIIYFSNASGTPRSNHNFDQNVVKKPKSCVSLSYSLNQRDTPRSPPYP